MDCAELHETKIHGSIAFPYSVYRGRIPEWIHSFPLHWHEDAGGRIEVERGACGLEAFHGPLPVHEGEDVFVVARVSPGAFEEGRVEERNKNTWEHRLSLQRLPRTHPGVDTLLPPALARGLRADLLRDGERHFADNNYCYAVEEGRFLIRLETKRGDMAKVRLHVQEKYLPVSYLDTRHLIPHLVGHLLVRGEPGGEYLVDHLVFRPAGEEEALLLPWSRRPTAGGCTSFWTAYSTTPP